MEYWNLVDNKATLKRQILNNNHKKINFCFNNILQSGIRFLIATDKNITQAEKDELIFEI